MIKRLLLSILSISSLVGNAQYSSLGIKGGIFSPEISDSETPMHVISGLDFKRYMVSFGTEKIALDFGWGISLNSINSRSKFELETQAESTELLYSADDENVLVYDGLSVTSTFISNNLLQIGPTLNFKLGKKMRFSYFYGFGAGINHFTYRTKYNKGKYSGSGAVINLADKLNEEDIQGVFQLTDNRNAPSFVLNIAESVRQSLISGITRNSVWEAGFEADISSKISLGISYSRLKVFNGLGIKSFGSKVKGKSINYQSEGTPPAIGEIENYKKNFSPETTDKSDFKWFENGRPEAFGNSTMLKLTIYL